MHDTAPPEADDHELDRFDEDLEAVGSALDALDADDLTTAEALTERLTVDDTAPAQTD